MGIDAWPGVAGLVSLKQTGWGTNNVVVVVVVARDASDVGVLLGGVDARVISQSAPTPRNSSTAFTRTTDLLMNLSLSRSLASHILSSRFAESRARPPLSWATLKQKGVAMHIVRSSRLTT